MQKKNLIYIIGGAALVGYFIWMKKKSSSEIPSAALPSTPDQELAPSFVNQTTEVIKNVAKKVRSRKAALKKAAPMIDEETGMLSPGSASSEVMAPSSPLAEVMQDMGIKKPIFSAKAARQSARSVKQEVKASGGSAKQARQAARSVRKEARQARKLGELPVTF